MSGNLKKIEPSRFKKLDANIIHKGLDPYTIGIYAILLCLGEKWDLTVNGLAAFLHQTKERIRKSFFKLEDVGFLRRERSHNDHGKFEGWRYEVGALWEDDQHNTANADVGIKPMSAKSDNHESPTLDGAATNRIIQDEHEDHMEKCAHAPEPEPGPEQEVQIGSGKVQHGDRADKHPFSPIAPSSPACVAKKNNKGYNTFDSMSALLGLGISAQTASDWMVVLHKKGAVLTKTAFEDLVDEIKKTGVTAEVCIAYAVKRSWKCFCADWYFRETSAAPSWQVQPRKPKQPNLITRMDTFEDGMKYINNFYNGPKNADTNPDEQ